MLNAEVKSLDLCNLHAFNALDRQLLEKGDGQAARRNRFLNLDERRSCGSINRTSS